MGLLNAFAGNPQFQQQLGSIMNGQGPGMTAPQFTPPPMQMNLGAGAGAPALGGRNGGFMRGGANPLNNYGMSMGDPINVLMQRMGPMAF